MGYLVLPVADAGLRWREGFKKLATVFYGWLLWTKFNTAHSLEQPKKGGAVLGAGRD
jgi:hypothetical protein